jgi:hypothetical protein
MSSLGDVLDDEGRFSIKIARANGVDHLIKKMKKTERKLKNGDVLVTYEYEMYDRLNALSQLRENFGMKDEPRSNSLETRRRQEVERSIKRIMERDKVDQPTAARMLLEALGDAPELVQIVSSYIN